MYWDLQTVFSMGLSSSHLPPQVLLDIRLPCCTWAGVVGNTPCGNPSQVWKNSMNACSWFAFISLMSRVVRGQVWASGSLNTVSAVPGSTPGHTTRTPCHCTTSRSHQRHTLHDCKPRLCSAVDLDAIPKQCCSHIKTFKTNNENMVIRHHCGRWRTSRGCSPAAAGALWLISMRDRSSCWASSSFLLLLTVACVSPGPPPPCAAAS